MADVLCRPAGLALFHHRRNTRDISLGGMRILADENYFVDTRLDVDVVLPAGEPVRCWVQVVWIRELGPSSPARFELGLKFTDIAPSDIQRLASVLVPAG